MGKETKIGLVVVAVVAVFFGAFVVQRFRQNSPGQQVAQSDPLKPEASEPASDTLEPPPVVVETGGFSIGGAGGDETDQMTYPTDEDLLDVPAGPGTENVERYQPADTYEEPSQWSSRSAPSEEAYTDDHSALPEGAALEPAAASYDKPEPSTTFSEPNDLAWETPTNDGPQTVTSGARQTTTVVDDARSSADYPQTPAGEQSLFDTGASVVDQAGTTITAPQPVEPLGPRESQPQQPAGTQQWIVEEGDSFWTISRRRYGSGRYFKALARWNKPTVPDPQQMRTGTVLETPPLALLEQTYSDLIAKPTSAQAASTGLQAVGTPAESGPFTGSLGQKFFRVGRSDTLFGIAKKTLGRGNRWKELYELNRDILEDPDRLAPGMILRLPSSAAVEELLSTRPDSGVIR